MSDVIVDDRLYQKGYPYVLFKFGDIRVEAEPGFSLDRLSKFITSLRTHTFKDATYRLIELAVQQRSVTREVKSGDLTVRLDVATDRFAIISAVYKGRKAVVFAPNNAETGALVEGIKRLKRGEFSQPKQHEWSRYLSVGGFFEYLKWIGPKFVEEELKEKAFVGTDELKG